MKRLVTWAAQARADLRTIDRRTALSILHAIDRYSATDSGDVKTLRPPMAGLRLRVGDWRVLFEPIAESSIQINRVLHRSEAYLG